MMSNPIMQLRSDKLADVSEVSIRTRLLELAAKLPDVIAMGRGDPDLATPPHIVEAGKKALDKGATHYTHVRGSIELRRAIAAKLKRENNLEYDPEDEILVTCGGQEAFFLSLFSIVNPGDEVIVPVPRYNAYDEAIKMWGGKPVVVPCKPEEDFAYKPEEIRKCITPRTKAISLVNPGNPVGIFDPQQVRAISQVAMDHNLIVISDEIYEHMIFDGTPHLSVAAVPGMRERTITINGPSKTYAMTGWRCGFMAVPRPLCEMLTEAAHTVAICCPAVTQAAALAAYTGPQDSVEEMQQIYNDRRIFMMKELDALGIKYVKPRGGFYIFADVTSLGLTPDEFCLRLLKEAQVMIFPGQLFLDPTNRYVRISLLSPTDRIHTAAQRMRQWAAGLKR